MSLALRYALKDLRGALSSFRIVLLCLILGVSAIAAVQLTSHSVLSGIEKNGRSLLGGDIVIRNIYAPATTELRTWLADRGASLTETIEARVMVANETTSDNTLAELKAVAEGYPQYGTFTADTGSNLFILLKDKGALLDSSLRDRLDLKAGDILRIGQGLFTVRGFITHEPDRAGSSRFGIAPRVMISATDMASTGLLQPGSMIYYHLRARFSGEINFDQMRNDLKTAFPDATWRITDSDNAAPGITRFTTRLMQFLTLVGLSALLIGGIGIGNGMRAHFESRLKTIAIFKTLGSPVNLIERIYFWQISIIACAGTLTGILIGASLPYIAAPYLSELLPFAVEPQVTWTGLLIPILFGILVSFVFTIWPLGQAIGTSPLELFRSSMSSLGEKPALRYRYLTGISAGFLGALAISTANDTQFAMWFVIGAIACLVIFGSMGWLMARIAGRLPASHSPALRLGLRNLHRPGNATVNTLISLGLGLTVMVSITLIEMNLRQGIAQNLPKDAPAFFFLDIQHDQKKGFEALLKSQPTAHTLKFSPNLRGRIVKVNGIPASEALKDQSESWLLQNDRGFTYTAELPAHSEITSGEWWPENYQGPPLISVVEDVERGFGVKPGDTITVNILGRDITARIANTRSVNWMNMTINFAITFAPGTLEAAPHTWLATVVADPSAETSIQRAIGKAYPNVSMIRLSESIAAAGDILGNIATAVRVTALVAIITGILVLAGSLAATRTQRLYDVIILKVLGIQNRTLMQSFLLEFGILGIMAGGLSMLLGSIISWAVMSQLMDLGWNFYAIPALLTGCVGIGLTILIGWVITGRILVTPAAPHLRND